MPNASPNDIAVLAGGLAHEIRNPLSTIGLNLELIAESLGGTEPDEADDRAVARRKRMLRTVQRECGHLSEILDAFLAFARAGEPELKEGDLNDLLAEFAEFFGPTAKAAGVRFVALPTADLPPVRFDGRLIRQVLMNLALNAQQALTAQKDAGSEIPQPLIEVSTRPILAGPSGGAVELTVADNGAGIPPETRATMWNPFYSSKPGGSGLGLPTVRKIVEAHGGLVHCESDEDGTVFRIALPSV
ncbi:Sensor protein ZraS [Planctomycetes bacterium LzC2]|uniref:histidine kinase n=2 Tax=Alienimonas chondri TaxID=2681879 RepID=A0ABX1V8E8_9PLAN|nr:Sensor protein ZraS [Alienimonas chondri]